MLIVKPLTAVLSRDTETFGNMDPYCVLTIGGQKETTACHKSGGKSPNWSDVFTFKKKD